MYHDRYGLDAICLRILSCFPRPMNVRMLSTWLSPDDAGRLFEACLTVPAAWVPRRLRGLGQHPRRLGLAGRGRRRSATSRRTTRRPTRPRSSRPRAGADPGERPAAALPGRRVHPPGRADPPGGLSAGRALPLRRGCGPGRPRWRSSGRRSRRARRPRRRCRGSGTTPARPAPPPVRRRGSRSPCRSRLPTASSRAPPARSMLDRWCSGENTALCTVATTAPSCSISIASVKVSSRCLMVSSMAPEASSRSSAWRMDRILALTNKTLLPCSSVIQKSSLMAKSRSRTR